MSASNATEDALLSLIFTNVDAANFGDATGLRGSTAPGSFYLGLHTGVIAETDTAQTTNEATYTGYARLTVGRAVADWTVTAGVVTNDNALVFGACTAGSNTITYFTLGQATSGAGAINFYGALTGSLAVSAGITPQYAAGAFQISMN